MTFGLLTKQLDRGQSCACPHLLVSGCFTRPPGTSTRNHPHEPTTSKPVVPGGYVCPLSIPSIHVRISTSRCWDPRARRRAPRLGDEPHPNPKNPVRPADNALHPCHN